MIEVLEHDDGYWGVYRADELVYIGDQDTAMMVAREMDEQWADGSGNGNGDLAPGQYEGIPEL